MEAVWREFFESDGYIDSAKFRVAQGRAPHLESYWLQKLNGKPVERIEHSGPDGGPIEVHDHFALPAA